MPKAPLVPALVFVAACAGNADLAGASSPCDGGGLDASTAQSRVDAPVADTAGDAASASDAAHDAVSPQEAAPSSCGDGVKDGNETDIDCGGSCPPCAIGQGCLVNGDCGSSPGCSSTNGCACDALSMTCVFDHCFDHRKDGNETDVDCGDPLAGCTGCAVGRVCQADGDCASHGCDATSSSCAQTTCVDHHQDGLETGVDCGGGVCPVCAVGQGCRMDSDCATAACDLMSFVCVQDQCADHRTDGTETGDDCGGSVCVARCQAGQNCLSNYDCAAGNFCNSSHFCQ